jgi:serine/threonine protein kinase
MRLPRRSGNSDMPDLEQIARKICQDRSLEFVKPVGEGTFKQTFQVSGSNGSLALKLYKAVGSSARDRREVDAMLRCNHRNIARLLSVDSYKYGGEQFVAITEEFLPGGTLTSKGHLTTTACFSIGGQLIDAVSHLAGLGLVHRDIKPDNILFRSDGATPVLTDFGIARDLMDSSLTPTWAPRGPGTPFFASPEQLNNQKYLTDWRSDQFSLGIALAFSTFGDHPYRDAGNSDRDVVDRVSSRQRATKLFVAAADASVPALVRMIEPWPVDRYRTPAQLADAWRRQKDKT